MLMENIDIHRLVMVVAIATLVASIGYGIDKLLRDHQRNIISENLLRWWSLIESLKLPDIPHKMATILLRLEKKVIAREKEGHISPLDK